MGSFSRDRVSADCIRPGVTRPKQLPGEHRNNDVGVVRCGSEMGVGDHRIDDRPRSEPFDPRATLPRLPEEGCGPEVQFKPRTFVDLLERHAETVTHRRNRLIALQIDLHVSTSLAQVSAEAGVGAMVHIVVRILVAPASTSHERSFLGTTDHARWSTCRPEQCIRFARWH